MSPRACERDGAALGGGGLEAIFQPTDGRWEDYAAREGLRSVLDPADLGGAKNDVAYAIAAGVPARLVASRVAEPESE